MKNSLKSFIVACVATIALGVHTNSALAITNTFIHNNPYIPVEETQNTNNLNSSAEKTVQPTDPKAAPVEDPAAAAISLSNNEKDLFARLVEAEAKGEPYEGKVAVATVVLNRVESPQFPDTVTDVINEVVGDAYAFSPVQNGEIHKPASEESTQAVEEALKREDTLNDSIFFYNPDIATDDWIRSRQTVKTIGNHVFAL